MCHSCSGKGCMCISAMICKILLIVGGLNWGLIGLGALMSSVSGWNIIHMVLVSMPKLEAVVYLLVGIAAVVGLVGCRCKKCMTACASCSALSSDGKSESNM